MPSLAYTDNIDLCFGNTVREFKNFVASPLACNLACAISGLLHLAYQLAWKHISEDQKRKQRDIWG